MRILITGKNGYIAKSLANNLKNHFDFTYPSFMAVCGKDDFDLTNRKDTTNWFRKYGYFDVVIHTAINGGSRLKKDDNNVLANNLKMFYNLLANKNRFGQLISFGSGMELNNPTDPYGLSKKIIWDIIKNDPKLNNIRKYADSLESKREYISSVLEELEVLEQDGGDKVVGRKISKLVAALKELQDAEVQGAPPKGISQRNLEMGKKIRGLNEIMVQIQVNSSEYIDEAVRELQQDIEEEREKLSIVEKEIERVNQYLPQLQQLTSLLERYTRRSRYQSSGDSLTERQQYRERFKERDERLRSHLSRLFNTLSELDDNLKKMSKRIDKLDEFTAREFTEWISGEAGRRPRVTATEIENFAQFEGGFDTYNNDDIRQIEELGARIEGNYERIEHWIGSFGTELRRRIYEEGEQ